MRLKLQPRHQKQLARRGRGKHQEQQQFRGAAWGGLCGRFWSPAECNARPTTKPRSRDSGTIISLWDSWCRAAVALSVARVPLPCPKVGATVRAGVWLCGVGEQDTAPGTGAHRPFCLGSITCTQPRSLLRAHGFQICDRGENARGSGPSGHEQLKPLVKSQDPGTHSLPSWASV